jgi:hypothetical protein
MEGSGDITRFIQDNGLPTSWGGNWRSNAILLFQNIFGFIIGPTAEVHAPKIIISTLNLSDSDFQAGIATGKFHFSGQGAYIINNGRLVAKPGGYVALLSGAIKNEGTIQAQLGTIVLASGSDMTVALDDADTIFVVIDKAVESQIFGPDGNAFNNAIENKGVISANGGSITLTAKSLNTIFDHSINNSGIIEAKSLSSTENGNVVLKAQGAILNTGTIEATNVTVAAQKGINSTGSLIATDFLKLLSQGPIYSLGLLQSSSLIERGATFQVGGIFSPGVADIKNADGAMEFTGSTSIVGPTTITDSDIIIDPNVTLAITGGNTSFVATNDFLMDPTATINGGGYNLTITAGSDATIGNITNVSALTITAGQEIVQEGAINTMGGSYTATAGSAYVLDWVLTASPSITSGSGIVTITAPTVAELGSSWSSSGDTETTYDWEYLGGSRGFSLIELGYYFSLSNGTIVHVPSLSVGISGNISSGSGAQNFININGVGSYIVMYTGSEGAPYGTPYTTYYWYSNPALDLAQNEALNADGYNHAIIIVPASGEEAWLANPPGSYTTSNTPYSSLVIDNSNGTIYNWEDSWNDYNDPSGQYFNDVIIESTATIAKTLIVTANPNTTTYGILPSPLTTISYTSINGATNPPTTGPTLTTTATTTSSVGTYSIIASGATDPTGTIIVYVPGTLTVNPASLNITVNNQSMVYGSSSLPALTVTYTGFVNGNTVASLTTQPTVTTTATASSPVVTGGYPITASGAVDPNYTITYTPGTLMVTPALLTVTATGPAIAYGTAYSGGSSTTNFGTNGLLNSDSVTSVTLTPTPTLTTTTPASTSYSVLPSAAVGSGLSNYTITYAPYSATVGGPGAATSSFSAYDLFQTNYKVNKIIYETLHPYQLSSNSYEPLVYFYHPLIPVDQSAFNGISLDEGAYDFIQNNLELNRLPPSYYGVQ